MKDRVFDSGGGVGIGYDDGFFEKLDLKNTIQVIFLRFHQILHAEFNLNQ